MFHIDVPPLDDMSELLEQVSAIRESRKFLNNSSASAGTKASPEEPSIVVNGKDATSLQVGLHDNGFFSSNLVREIWGS